MTDTEANILNDAVVAADRAAARLSDLSAALRTQDPERISRAIAAAPTYAVPAQAITALHTLHRRFGGRLLDRDSRCEDCLALLTDCDCGGVR